MTSTGPNAKKLQKLEEDFNGGDPIDLAPYQKVLSLAGSMGFTTEDALEAALVTGTAENITLIADYMLLGESEKKKKYEKKKAESTKEVKLTPEQEKHIDELKNLHKQIQQEQFKIHQLEQELQERQEVTKTEKCAAFFQGIMADETITETETDAIETY